MNDISEIGQIDITNHIHSQTILKKHEKLGPLVIEKGEGVYVYDEHGKAYIESMAGLWCASLGFSDKRLAEAASEQLNVLPYYHTFNHRTNNVVSKLSEEIASIAPMSNSHLFFANSGSEANDSMIKMAWNYFIAKDQKEKRKVISHEKGFHGSTIAGASMSGLPHMHEAFGLPMDWNIYVQAPHYYRSGRACETEEQFTQRLIEDLEATIEREGADTIAAFIAEPIMGAGGVVTPPKGYFEKVQQVLKKNDILLLSDEIVCGFGRTGHWFGCQLYNFVPDMLVCAKGLTSGYAPMSCVIVSEQVYSEIARYGDDSKVFGHGFTYSGHPVSAAVALKAIQIYKEMNLPKLASNLGNYLHDKLSLLESHPLIGEIRGAGHGFVAGLEIVQDKRTKFPFSPSTNVGGKIEAACRLHGLIVRNMGDVIALCPPYVITSTEIDTLVEKLTISLDLVWNEVAESKEKGE
ncbi:aminotransferase [Vibrio sp. Vb339]|uniref:aminotransferase n=1 Tax=Vibrio sp. Vb339 TaxID=1192013 RepID=UPI001553DCA4|nr:aminotransferase [Vibrio sp. Vb339]